MQNQLFFWAAVLGIAQKHPRRLARLAVRTGRAYWTVITCPGIRNLGLLGLLGTLSSTINPTASLALLAILATQLPWVGGNWQAMRRAYRLLRGLPPLFDEAAFKASLVEATDRELNTQAQAVQDRLVTPPFSSTSRRELRTQLRILYVTLAERRAARQALIRAEPLGKPSA